MFFHGILEYLKAHNFKYVVYYSKLEFDKYLYLYRMAIVRIKTKSGGHFFLVIRSGDKYFTLNQSNDDTYMKPLVRLSRILNFTHAACIY